jgi:hypothetical protein
MNALDSQLSAARRAFLVMAAADGVHTARLRFYAAIQLPEHQIVPVSLSMVCLGDVDEWAAEWLSPELEDLIWARYLQATQKAGSAR